MSITSRTWNLNWLSAAVNVNGACADVVSFATFDATVDQVVGIVVVPAAQRRVWSLSVVVSTRHWKQVSTPVELRPWNSRYQIDPFSPGVVSSLAQPTSRSRRVNAFRIWSVDVERFVVLTTSRAM